MTRDAQHGAAIAKEHKKNTAALWPLLDSFWRCQIYVNLKTMCFSRSREVTEHTGQKKTIVVVVNVVFL